MKMEKNEKAYLPIRSSRFLSFAECAKSEPTCPEATSGLTPGEIVLGADDLDVLEKGFDLFFMQEFPELGQKILRLAA